MTPILTDDRYDWTQRALFSWCRQIPGWDKDSLEAWLARERQRGV